MPPRRQRHRQPDPAEHRAQMEALGMGSLLAVEVDTSHPIARGRAGPATGCVDYMQFFA